MHWNQYDSRRFAWLEQRAGNVYSQNGEDGILAAIFERIGATNKWCCECGAADGIWFSNTRQFIEDNWNAVLIEGDEKVFSGLVDRYVGWTKHHTGTVYPVNAFVAPTGDYTFDKILSECHVPIDMDLLIIDVDGQDYYLFNSLWKYQPRVVVCEYHPDFDPMFIPEIGGKGQAGDKAIIYVGDARGYMPVAKTRYNVIFVRKDLIHLVADPLPDDTPAAAESTAVMPKVGAVMSTPRLGPLVTSDLVYKACYELGMSFSRGEGVWWHHSLTRCIESHLNHDMEIIVTIDYDSIFTKADAARLVMHLYDNPDVDVVASIQMKREGGEALINSDGEVVLNNALVPMTQAHFGLTAFRRRVFEQLPRPWFHEAPDPNGTWSDGRIDPDIHFWAECRKKKFKMMAATDVVIGHMEWVVTWPSQTFTPIYQPLNHWRREGMPGAAFKRPGQLQAAQLEMK